MSTHGCFLLLFPLSLLPGCRNQMLEPRIQTPPSTTTPTRRRLLLHAARRRRSGVVRRIPGRRHAPRSICIPVCASHLTADLFNLCLYSDIVASADSSMIEHLYSSPRGPWLAL